MKKNLLYIEIDLGNNLSFSEFKEQVDALNSVHALAYSHERKKGPDFSHHNSVEIGRPAPLTIVRSSIASPWVTVLGDVVSNYQPIAYGAATLFGIERVMSFVQHWQRHRVDLDDKRVDIEHKRWSIEQARRIIERGIFSDGVHNLPESRIDETAQQIHRFGPIREVELIAEGDPRATGRRWYE